MTDNLGFLVSDVSRLMRKRFDERARLVGATRAQWKTLLTLTRHQGINQGGLAELLEVEPITLCRMVDRLEEAGMVERRRDPSDRRAWRIYLTDAAQPVLEQLRDYADEMFEAALYGLAPADQAALSAYLHRIRDNLTYTQSKDLAHG